MISKEDFRIMEREYDTWLAKHPKGDHNYKSFSHMRRSIEFAKYYNDKQVKKLTIPVVRKCTCEIPEPRMKNSENGVSGYCVNCVKPL